MVVILFKSRLDPPTIKIWIYNTQRYYKADTIIDCDNQYSLDYIEHIPANTSFAFGRRKTDVYAEFEWNTALQQTDQRLI